MPVYLVGAVALLISLFLPLSGVLAASRAQADDGPAPAPDEVAVVGDFQTALGCPEDFHADCDLVQLAEDDGRWTATLPIPPGSYEYQIVARGIDGQQRVYGEDGRDGDPLELEVGDDDSGVFFAFDPRTDDVTAEPVGARFTLVTADGEEALFPGDDGLTIVVSAPGGDFPFLLLADGEPVADEQSVPLDPGLYRLFFDEDGNLVDAELLTEGSLSVTRGDGATGACYQLRDDGELVNQACDVDDGEDGTTNLTFPDGLEPGGYTLVESRAPEGAEAAPETDVELAEGDNSVEVAAGDGAESRIADIDTDTETATDADTETTTDEDTETSTSTSTSTSTATEDGGGEPGDLIVTLQGEDGAPVGGACFELVDQNDEVIAESCDTAEFGDTNPGNGNTGFFGVPSGPYTLRLSQAPEGVESVDEQEVTVEPGGQATETVTATAAPIETVTETETETETETTTETATDAGVGDLVVLRGDDAGNAVGGACFEIVDETGATVADEVCDEDGDVADDGRIGFADVPAGVWTLRETRTPETVEPAAEQPVEIFANDVYDLPVQSAAVADAATETETQTQTQTETDTATATETEAPPGDLIVTLQDESGSAVGGACFELVDEADAVIAESCDTAEFGDTNPGNGRTGFFGVPSGPYTLRLSDAPEGVEPPEDQDVEVPAGGDPGTAVVTVAVAATTETETATETETETETDTATDTDTETETVTSPEGEAGTLIVELGALGADPVNAPVCVELNTGGGIGLTDPPAACDNGDRDASGDAGIIVLDGVPAGDYTLSVTDGPAGATEVAPQTVTIPAGGETTVTLSAPTPTPSEPEIGTLPVVAVDAEDAALPGACWVLAGAEGEIGPRCDDDSNGGTPDNGSVTFEDVPAGDYTLRADTPPEGYLPAADQPVTVANGDNAEVRVAHEPAPATVRVTTTSSDGERLSGACYTFAGGDELCDSDGDGVLNFEGIAAGTYTLDQTTPPEGFAEAADQEVDVPAGQSLVEVGVVNEAATGTVGVVVQDEATAPLNDACATVDGGEEVCDGAENDAFPDEIGLIGIAEVAPGERSVALSEVPADFQPPAAGETVTVVADDTAEAVFILGQEEPATGVLELTVRTTGDEAVTGACVVLTNDEGEIALPCDGADGDTDADDGEIRVETVPEGTYEASLSEEFAATLEGFESASTDNVEVDAAAPATGVIVVELTQQPTTGSMQIIVRDAESRDRLAGTCFELRGGANPISLCDDEEGEDSDGRDGIIVRADIPPATYSLVQTQTPDTHEAAANQDGVVITAGATTTEEIDLQAKEQPGTLVVRKVDSGGNLLGGACFEVRQNDARVAKVCDATDATPNDGILSFELPAGDYRLVETKTPSSDYRAADPRTVTIAAGEETGVDVRNRLRPGRVEVVKVDAADPDERLEDACFELRGARTYGPNCDDDDRSADGKTVFESVPPGEYTVVETQPPAGYDAAPNRTIDLSPGGLVRITVQNEASPPPPEQGRLIVYKQDGARQELPGGCFRLYDGDRAVSRAKCDIDDGANDATIVFDPAPVGTWTLRETLAPSPDFQIGAPVEITVEADETTEHTFVNQLKRGRILIRKTNPHGQPLQGACFDVAGDDRGERCTDAHGRVSFDDLAPGRYSLTETRAPYGYEAVPPREDVRVQPGRTTTLDLVDPIAEPEPDTGSIQVQKFVCDAGKGGERTVFFGGGEGNDQLKKTAGCHKANAEFTLSGANGGGPGAFATGSDGQYQVTLPAGTYTLTETAPDLPGSSETGVRVRADRLTTVIVINYVAPPAPEPATINVVKYTCEAGFEGHLYADFADDCAEDDRLTNHITVRADGPVNARAVTGEDGERGHATLADLPAGHYEVYEEKPYDIPTAYAFCGFDADDPSEYKRVNGRIAVTLEAGSTLTCAFFNIPEEKTAKTGTILVRKYVCEVNDPPATYDWYEECHLSDEEARFELNTYVIEGDRYEPYGTGTTNPDGILRFPRLQPGTYQLKEIGSNWCHAESDSVNSKGDVVVRIGQVADVYIFNCVDTKNPPNTGAGPNAGTLPGGEGIVPGLAWPLALLAVWGWQRRRGRWAEAA